MAFWLEPLNTTSWTGLGELSIDEWLWIDTAAPGVHVADRLPASAPEVTHVWGWGPSAAIRARVDVDLQTDQGDVGVVGAILRWGDRSPDDRTVSVRETRRHVWDVADDRAAMPVVAGLSGDSSAADLLSLETHVDVGDGERDIVLMPLVFLRRASR